MPKKNPKKLLSSALLVLVAGLLVAGCGTDKQESVALNLESFTSPDGNIGCVTDGSMVRCDIKQKSWKAKPNRRCELDYGRGLTMADGDAKFVCAGDTTLGSGPVLSAGKINKVGPFECSTNPQGDNMRCENMTTGHGFDLSARRYQIF